MPNYSKNDTVLVRYPFSDLSATKVRPAVIVNVPYPSQDLLLVPLTSQLAGLRAGEFILGDWSAAGLHIPTALKRGIYTIHARLVIKRVGQLSQADSQQLDQSLKGWLGL